MKNIVILHGYTLAETGEDTINRDGIVQVAKFHDWYHVMEGHESRLGRIPTALDLARHLKADHLIFTTGASREPNGKWEAEVIYEITQRYYKRLLSQFPHRFNKRTWRSEQAYRRWLEGIARFDTTSKNTSECLQVVQQMIRQDVLQRRERVMVYNVSSANHMPRILRDAGVAFKIGTHDAPLLQYVTMIGVPAETCYGERFVGDTKVDDLGRSLFTKAELRVEFMREFNISKGVQEYE